MVKQDMEMTTILAKSFLNHIEKFNDEKSYDIPFYIWLKDKGCKYHFDFEKYIQECFIKHKNKEAYPYLELKSVVPYFIWMDLMKLQKKFQMKK